MSEHAIVRPSAPPGAGDYVINMPEDPGQNPAPSFCARVKIKIKTVAIELGKIFIAGGLSSIGKRLGDLLGYPQVASSITKAIEKAFGVKEDRELGQILSGCLQFELCCFTEERLLEILRDYESGKIKQRLEEEFLKIEIKITGLEVEIQNMEEVEKRYGNH